MSSKEAIDTARVLVVDDDWLNRELLEAYLADAGCEVLTAYDGKKALEIVAETPPDLVLLDVNMPGMNGYEVCAHLKRDPQTQFIPVVMVTALEAEADKIKAIEAGADDFVSKPFNSYLLLARVRSLLRIKRLHDELEARNGLLRQLFTRYVDEGVADIILEDPERYMRLGGDIRHVTVVFADIRGFTAFAERHPAQQVVETLNYLFAELTDIIKAHQGTFDKYVGDEIVAFFGAPVSHGKDALNAVRMAWQMQRVFMQLVSGFQNEDLRRLQLKIGLHSGDAVVGNVGSERAMNYTVIGDTVNTAKRLQESADGGQTLISVNTFQLVRSDVQARPLQPRMLEGKSEPIMVYELLEVDV
jgi:class 3 adenylate cyclase/CheY-like chemotaxis protein